jgi:hypothetical protein
VDNNDALILVRMLSVLVLFVEYGKILRFSSFLISIKFETLK